MQLSDGAGSGRSIVVGRDRVDWSDLEPTPPPISSHVRSHVTVPLWDGEAVILTSIVDGAFAWPEACATAKSPLAWPLETSVSPPLEDGVVAVAVVVAAGAVEVVDAEELVSVAAARRRVGAPLPQQPACDGSLPSSRRVASGELRPLQQRPGRLAFPLCGAQLPSCRVCRHRP